MENEKEDKITSYVFLINGSYRTIIPKHLAILIGLHGYRNKIEWNLKVIDNEPVLTIKKSDE